jgi:hypothetical protein
VSRHKADELEEVIERMERGESVGDAGHPYLETIQQVRKLAAPVPPPPHNLAPGRQRLLAEAARLRENRTARRQKSRRTSGVMKLGTALIVLVLVSGLVFGAGRAMADSLPGDALYGAKLAVERWQRALTGDATAIAGLDVSLAERRMDEVDALLRQNRTVDEPTASRAQLQLEVAIASAAGAPDESAAGALERLALAIQERQQTMEQLMGASPQQPVQQLLRTMERVREEAHAGAGDPAGLRQRLREGTPSLPPTAPEPGGLQQSGQQEPQGPQPGAEQDPGSGPGPGAQPSVEPGSGPGPGAQPSMEPGSGPGPGPQPTVEPGTAPGPGPQPSLEPGSGPGPGPEPSVEPGSGPGPGPQPTEEPASGPSAGPQSTEEPDSGPGSGPQPTAEPGAGPGSGAGGSQKP